MSVLKSIFCLTIGLLGMSLIMAQTTDGLIAYYSFDACDATDDLGNGEDGMLNGDVECGCGAVGNALIFDGVDDWVGFGVTESDALSQFKNKCSIVSASSMNTKVLHLLQSLSALVQKQALVSIN